MGDTGGGQEMYIHASNTQSVGVGASATTKVGANETHDVNGGCGVHVGSQTVSVGGSQKVAVGSDVQTQVKGARTEVVGAVESIGVKASHRVQTGSYSEVVGALYGIQCNATATMVSGPLVELVGGNLVQIAGLGTHESVAGARTELVAGARNMVAAIGCEDETWGAKLVSVGAAKENAGGNVETAAATGAINVSGSARITAGGKIQIEAASITIEAASLTMGAGASAKLDGNLGLRGGTTKLDAPVTKRKSGAKVEG
jgi:type VI secretion system secreted protein VgrG